MKTAVVEDVTAARTVTDPTSRKYLEPFLGCERRASDVSRELGVATSTVLYWVNRFLALRLLEVARTELRPGRPIRYYRSTADGFFIPFSKTHLTSPEMLSAYVFRPRNALLEHSVGRALVGACRDGEELGIYFGRRESSTHIAVVPASLSDTPCSLKCHLLSEASPVVTDSHATLNLRREDAKRLQRELVELIALYEEKQVKGAATYFARVALAPA